MVATSSLLHHDDEETPRSNSRRRMPSDISPSRRALEPPAASSSSSPAASVSGSSAPTPRPPSRLHVAVGPAAAGSSQSSSPGLPTPSSSSLSVGARGRSDDDPEDASATPRPDYSFRRDRVDDRGDHRDSIDSIDDLDDPYTQHPAAMASWSGQPSIKGSTEAVRMVLLTFVTIGFTFTWGVEMTYCTPYLLALGLSKSNTALVWIAGPLSGLLVQPVIGVIADESKSKWGRRRPLMAGSTIIVAGGLLVLGFTREIVGWFIKDDKAAKYPTIILAVLSIYIVDFAINAVMSCSKSLIADTLPIEKQQAGAAWSSRMSSIGHIIGYGAGAVDLVQIFGTTLGDTQFKQLTVISTIFILGATAITCWAVTERVLISSKVEKHQGHFKIFRQIGSTLWHLPPRIRAICWAVFWSWIGWFPFLFYSTTWVGETYFRYDVSPEDRESKDVLGTIGRIGSTSLVLYSIITFAGAWLLPLIVQSPEDNSFTHRPPPFLAGFMSKFSSLKPDLLTTWMFGHLMFAGAMALAPFATSFRFATVLVCLCGIPWALAMWAPTAFLGVEVNKMSSNDGHTAAYHRFSADTDIELPDLDADDAAPLRLQHGSDGGGSSSPTASTGELSGIYFGILNIYTTLPQFVGTFISTVVFAIFEPGKSPELSHGGKPGKVSSPEGPNAIAVCLFIGAMSTLVAAYMTRKLKYM